MTKPAGASSGLAVGLPTPSSAAAAAAANSEDGGVVPSFLYHPRVTALLPVVLVGTGCLHALLQEKLVLEFQGKVPLLITSFELGSCSSLSLLWLLGTRTDPRKAPWGALLRIAALTLASLVAGNTALRWVSYPVKVVAKSCKLLPTMALGTLLLRKRYSFYDQLAALLLCAGLVGFTLAEQPGGAGGGSGAGTPPSSPLGVGLLLFAVSCDAVQVLESERMLRAAPHLSPMHVMLYTNGFAFLAVAAALFCASGELDALAALQADKAAREEGGGGGDGGSGGSGGSGGGGAGAGGAPPPPSLPWALLLVYGTFKWVGVVCFIALTRSWGATTAVLCTNARKLLTVALSFLLFPKPFQPSFALSGAAVALGVSLHTRAKKRPGAKRGKEKD